jgi:GNAT superfamily N-acetyltransferase
VIHDYHAAPGDGAGHKAITLELHERPVGFAYYAPTPMTVGTWYLYWIFVDKNIQAKGMGARMMHHVEHDIRAMGGRVLFIETSGLPNYELTRKFYLKLDYLQVAVLPDFYAEGDDMCVFLKKLNDSAKGS